MVINSCQQELSFVAVTVVVYTVLETSIKDDCCAFEFRVTVTTNAAFATSCKCDVTLFEKGVELRNCVTIALQTKGKAALRSSRTMSLQHLSEKYASATTKRFLLSETVAQIK